MKNTLVLACLVSLLNGSGAPASAANSPAAETERIDRLAQLCKVWGAVRHLHPYLAYKDIDWDAALIHALPRVRAAKTADEYATAVQSMLDALGDPVTRVVRQQPMAGAAGGKASGAGANDQPKATDKLYTWIQSDVLAICLHDISPSPQFFTGLAELSSEVTKARGVICDCRQTGNIGDTYYADLIVSRLQNLLVSRELISPTQRYLVHSGYRPQSGTTSGGYYTAFQTKAADVFQPLANAPARPSAFLVNDKSVIPPLALALQQAGDGFLIAQGKVDEAAVVSVKRIRLSDGVQVRIRTSELVGLDGSYSFQVDAEVPATADPRIQGPAFQKACALIQQPAPDKRKVAAARRVVPVQAVWRPDKSYAEMANPALDYRLLALFRFWNVIDYFYPYKHLIGDWDAVLTQFLPKFEAAGSAQEYALTIAEMGTHVADGHTGVFSPELSRYFGSSVPPIALRMVEGVPLVSAISDDRAAQDAGIQIGDVLLKVDDEPVEKRMARYGKYLAASTPSWHSIVILGRLLAGPEGSTVKLTLRDSQNRIKEVSLSRRGLQPQFLAILGASTLAWIGSTVGQGPLLAASTLSTGRTQPPQRGIRGETFKMLPGNMGYVDLKRLTVPEVDGMFEKFKETQAIIFDNRGYPQGTAWAIAPRLNVKGARYGAAFQRRLVSWMGSESEDEDEDQGKYSFLQPLPTTDKWKYAGKTVMLIDERAISQAEHTGLFFEAACDITFIGSHTAGANGDVTNFSLPGGVRVLFTGHDVRHADGRQLQRVGLVPHIEVKPTIQGIREGKDEVLERAIKYLREGK
jgi:C-terminal processing protease CtpA/Prc